jgi:purine-nucleoside phosphorylase
MKPFLDRSLLEEAARAVREAFPDTRPQWAVILGSGWTMTAPGWREKGSLLYRRIPGFGIPSVAGHLGVVKVFSIPGGDLLVFHGRRHWYETGDWNPIALPIHVARRMGCRGVLLTNAAGGIREDLSPGQLMVVDDHINGLGLNPLVGNADWWSDPFFTDLSVVYDAELRAILCAVGREQGGVPLSGVYAAVSGPSYETPAEIRALRSMGADAVGMSTVPEAILARAAGLKVAALALICNRAAGLGGPTLSHSEVLETSRQSADQVMRVLTAGIEKMMLSLGPDPSLK